MQVILGLKDLILYVNAYNLRAAHNNEIKQMRRTKLNMPLFGSSDKLMSVWECMFMLDAYAELNQAPTLAARLSAWMQWSLTSNLADFEENQAWYNLVTQIAIHFPEAFQNAATQKAANVAIDKLAGSCLVSTYHSLRSFSADSTRAFFKLQVPEAMRQDYMDLYVTQHVNTTVDAKLILDREFPEMSAYVKERAATPRIKKSQSVENAQQSKSELVGGLTRRFKSLGVFSPLQVSSESACKQEVRP